MDPNLYAALMNGLAQIPRGGLVRLLEHLRAGRRVLLNGNVYSANGYG